MSEINRINGLKGAQTPERMEELRQRKLVKDRERKGMTAEEWEAYQDSRDDKPRASWRYRRAYRKLLEMSTERFETYKPRNGYEKVAKAVISAVEKTGKEGQVIVQVSKEIRESLGEKDTYGKNSNQPKEAGASQIINDLPGASYIVTPELEN